MALMYHVFFPAPDQLHPDSAVYCFLMQVGMAIGVRYRLADQRVAC